MSQIIYVADIDDYIGKSVKSEIAYAEKPEKEVIYYSQFEKCNCQLTNFLGHLLVVNCDFC
ncbi:MAG: hypothetical protein J6K58_13180 [Lachnospiraceae bacterium]|nr:hypothetical protein [Lachnospiraceae bacterium]